MTVSAFLRTLADRDVRIAYTGDRLQLNAAEGALTPELRAEITARKAEIIAFLQSAQQSDESAFVLRHASENRPLPLSFAQQRLWFLHQLHPDDTSYNLGISRELPGIVDETLLHWSLEGLAKRHDILRTIFREVDGVPSQVVTSTLPSLRVVDLVDVPEDRREAEIARLRDAEVRQPFDLAAAPAIRATLIRIDAQRALFVIVVHHILADGWSLGLLIQQLGDIYEMLRVGRDPASDTMAWQYADYAYSEQRWFEESDQQPHIAYWKTKLDGTLPPLDLPMDRPRGPAFSSRGAVQSFTIPAVLANKLRALSRQSGVTLFTTILAIFKVLLYRYSGQTDILVGTPFANRKQIELESLIGLFVSTLVLRTDLSEEPSFHKVLQRVHNTVLDAYEHQDYPFEKLVDLVRPDRSLAQSPLFQTAFILQNTPLSRTYDTISAGAAFELSLFVWDGADDLPGSFEYNADLFDPETVARMASHFLVLAEAVVADPDCSVARLPLLTTAERTQIVETWNETATDYPCDTFVHVLFEEQAAATPDAIAIIAPSADDGMGGATQQLTYHELDQRANCLAHRLRQLGITPGTTVGVALGRSIDFLVAVLAILKCEAAYVPIDPALPEDRLAMMLTDADVPIVLTSMQLRASLPKMHAHIVCLDHDEPAIVVSHVHANLSGSVADVTPARRSSRAAAETMAYVMYTSGSTGRPKGVCIPHRAIVRLVRNTNYVRLDNREVILACAPVSFDASTFEIWGSLLNGGTLVLYPQPIPEPDRISQYVRQYGVTTLWLTAGLFHVMAETKVDGFKGVRQLLAGGDVLSPTYVRKVLRVLDGGVVINGYGPTENTTFTCCYTMANEQQVDESIPIGRPIANTRVYILDRNMQPVPIGVRGELWAGGDGVALGYQKDQLLTASRFRPDPFSHDPAARMYRTGDIVRYRPDGLIEFFGRIDKQIKIRGFRVELGEIEHVLCEYPAVRDAVVVAHEQGIGNKQLIGYVVPAAHQEVSLVDLKEFLQARLPEYAVPSAYMALNAWPLTPNGKIDYDALPTPGVEGRQERVSPYTALETQLLIIWEHVLGVSGIGRNDNFFDLGGNSLLGMRLLSSLEKALGKRVPVAVLFRGQTIASMAAALQADYVDVAFRAVAIQPNGSRPPLFIIPGVNGNIIGYEKLALALGPDQPVYGLRSVGLEGETDPLDRVDAIVTHFVPEIRRVQPEGPYYLLGFCMGGIIAYEIAQQLIAQGESVDLLGLIDTWPPTTIPNKLWTSRLGQQVVYLGQGAARHLRALWTQPRGHRLRYLREKAGIISEMVAQRDVYRGEHYTLYSDLVMRANQHAASRYVPAEYPGRLFLIVTSESEHDVASATGDLRLTWRDFARGGCIVRTVRGKDSGSLLKPPFVQGLADVILEQIEHRDAALEMMRDPAA